jgi:tetratricopeptide (TPR) repeat protein
MKSTIEFTHQGIEVVQATLRIRTYLDGPADPNPPLFGKGVRAIYPYSWRKSFTREIAERKYDALVMRSPWIELTILPDWGFHLYRAVDRVTGRDLFHCPAVMKPAHNAIRGAYVAGGVEFNFPIGHNAMTWDRVGLNIRKTDEGVTVLFQDVERRSGMHWAAGVTLAANVRGILFDQYFHNATPEPQPWYFWLNAGLAPHPSLRFVFPTRQMLGHFEGSFLETLGFYSFPVHGSADYSRDAEIPEPIGLFSPSNYFGWFGAWYEDWDFGVARWAAPWQVGGQKLWSWGTSEEGRLWGRIGADQELPIPEIQSGRPETQMDRQIMRPFDTASHREWWFPVSGTGGLQSASRFGALNVAPQGARNLLKISLAQPTAGCQVLIDGRAVEGRFDLSPGHVREIQLPASLEHVQKIQLRASQGTILEWSREPAPLAANVGSIVDSLALVDEMSAEQLFLRGFKAERTLRPDLARRFYQRALDRDPGHSLTHRQLGLMHLLAGEPGPAAHDLAQALARNRWDEQALYLHGLAASRNGDAEQARADWYRVAATGDGYVVPAMLMLAGDCLRRDEPDGACRILDDVDRLAARNAHALFLRCVAARRQGRTDLLEQTCRDLDRILGISLMARMERGQAGIPEETERIPAEAETEDRLLLATAIAYDALGLSREIEGLWSAVQSSPVKTELGYLVRGAAHARRRAPDTPLFWAWGEAERRALVDSLAADPDDVAAHFGLGCLLAETGQFDTAVEHLSAAAQRRPADSVVRTTLGRVYLEAGRSDDAIQELEAALAGQPENPTTWVLLDQARGLCNRRDEPWLKRVRSAARTTQTCDEFREAWARLAADLGHDDEAAEVLATHWFHPYELSQHLRNLWVHVHRQKAVMLARAGNYGEAHQAIQAALAYPENLQLAKPLRSFDARTLYTAGRIMELAGEGDEARSYYQRAAAEDQPGPTSAKPWAALAEWKLGRPEQGRARLSALEAEAAHCLAAAFQPDLEPELTRIVELARNFQDHPDPDFEVLRHIP